jgi:hypothetical protein
MTTVGRLRDSGIIAETGKKKSSSSREEEL